MDWNTILQSGAVSAVVVAALGGLFLRANRKAEAKATDAAAGKTSAETDGLITEAARDVVAFYREEFVELRGRVERAEDRAEELANEVAVLRSHVEHLERVLRSEGVEPPSRPPIWKAG